MPLLPVNPLIPYNPDSEPGPHIFDRTSDRFNPVTVRNILQILKPVAGDTIEHQTLGDAAVNPVRQNELLELGILAVILGDFSFVWDERPKGEEDKKIPDHDFTAYFTRHQIPVAPRGTKLHPHDKGHISSYQKLFVDRDFGSLAHRASANALGDSDLETQFTGAMDRFGDEHRNLLDMDAGLWSDGDDRERVYGYINGARIYLARLIRLADHVPIDQELSEASQALFDRLWQNLGFRARQNGLFQAAYYRATTSRQTSPLKYSEKAAS